MGAAERIEWWGEYPALLHSEHLCDQVWDEREAILWWSQHPVLSWSEHPWDAVDPERLQAAANDNDREPRESGTENKRRLFLLGKDLAESNKKAAAPTIGGQTLREAASSTPTLRTFPLARERVPESRRVGARASTKRRAARESPRQGEAQPAQAQAVSPLQTVVSQRGAEQAGGWGLPPTKHIYVGSERVASKMDPTWFNNPPVVYLSSDHLGTAQYTTNNRQALVQHDEYLPTGEPWFSEVQSAYSLVTKHLYAGKEYDGATKLYDYGARHYDPRQGQWISPDPIMASYMRGAPAAGVYWPANLNSYGFVANNPIKYMDQDGEFVIAAAVVAGIFIGGGIETYRQYSAAGQAAGGGPVSLGSLDWGRIGFAAGIGGVGGLVAGGASVAAGSALTSQLIAGGLSGSGVGMGSSTSMQLYDGRSWSELDRQGILQAGLLGAAGGVVGAAGGFALNHWIRETFSSSSNAVPMMRVLAENVARTNKSTLGNVVGDSAQSAGVTAGDIAGPALGATYSEGAGPGPTEGGAAVSRPGADQGNAIVPTPSPSEVQPGQPRSGRGINPQFRPYLKDAK